MTHAQHLTVADVDSALAHAKLRRDQYHVRGIQMLMMEWELEIELLLERRFELMAVAS